MNVNSVSLLHGADIRIPPAIDTGPECHNRPIAGNHSIFPVYAAPV